MGPEITYCESLAGDDILHLFTLFCNHEVEKPVRVDIFGVWCGLVRVVNLISPHNCL